MTFNNYFKNHFELYEFIKSLGADLTLVGEKDQRDALLDAMYSGSTAGEVLGAIRLQLKSMNNSSIIGRLPQERQNLIDEAISYLDYVLFQRYGINPP